jgi:hypothetical protein
MPTTTQASGMHGSKRWTGWADLIPAKRWAIYRNVIEAAQAHQIPFSLAGAFATATHTGRWRDTNDMDLYALPQYHEQMKTLIEGSGLKDIYEQFPYKRDWTYRATDGETIMEVIWKMRTIAWTSICIGSTGGEKLKFGGLRFSWRPRKR